MPATPAEVTRTDDTAGDAFEVFENDAGRAVQSVALSPEVQGELLSHAASAGAAENTFVLKATPGRVFSGAVLLDPTVAAARYLMVFNLAAAPTAGAVPLLRFYVPAAGQGGFDLGLYGLQCDTGIALAVSTTPDTLTLPGSSEGFFQGSYV